MRKLDFLIVGCMKGGTTTLVDYINGHKDLSCLENELQYFSDEKFFLKGEQWYQRKLSKNNYAKLVGEKSTAYSYVESAPARIIEYNPDIKIIWMFRDPVRRAYSNYWHAVMGGNEARSFEDCVQSCLSNEVDDVYKDYIARSYYSEQVRRYLDYFSFEQMHFIFVEDFWSGRDAVLRDLAKFLGVTGRFDPSAKSKVSNKGYRPFSIKLQYVSTQLLGNSLLARGARFVNRKLGTDYPEMNENLRKELNAHFKPYNKQLFELLGREKPLW